MIFSTLDIIFVAAVGAGALSFMLIIMLRKTLKASTNYGTWSKIIIIPLTVFFMLLVSIVIIKAGGNYMLASLACILLLSRMGGFLLEQPKIPQGTSNNMKDST
jgi:hypothetical protein